MKWIAAFFALLLVFGNISCIDRSERTEPGIAPKSNQETLEKFLPNDVEILLMKPHSNGDERIGIFFVSDHSLFVLKNFYTTRFEQCRVDIDLNPNLTISVFESDELPAVLTAGRDEPANKGLIRIFVSEGEWQRAVNSKRETIGVLAVESHLLPDRG